MILEHISKPEDPFLPKSIEQYTALQIFLRLGADPSNIHKYVIAAERHSVPALVKAYKRSQSNLSPDEFFIALQKN